MPQALLARCEEARQRGDDFPTIWRSVLTGHPLVLGLPSHEVLQDEAAIVVRLITGQRLLCSLRGFRLD